MRSPTQNILNLLVFAALYQLFLRFWNNECLRLKPNFRFTLDSCPRQHHYREGKVHCKNNLMAWPPSWNLAVSQKKLPRLSNNALHTGDVFITFFKKGCPPKETDERVLVHFETRRWITDFALLNHDCLITLFYQLPFLSQRKSSYKHTEMQKCR